MVTSETIEVALGRVAASPLEVDQWDQWIADARMLIEARLGDLALLDQAKLDYVVREAVTSHIRHPDDATQVSESIDDYSTARTYRTGKGRVTILDEWWDLLSPTQNAGAFTLDMVSSTSTNHLPWCSSMFGAPYCSCGADIAGVPIYEVGW